MNNLITLRQKFKHKICYSKKYEFLNLKHTPSQALTTRLIKRGNKLKTYKLLKFFFYKYTLKKNLKTIPETSNFIFFYNKYFSFRDLDRVLFWKFNYLNIMFTHKVRYFRKKKQQTSTLKFIRGIKRSLCCINFLKYLILLNCQRKKKKMIYNLFAPLMDYLSNDKNSMVVKVKYKIYRQKLVQLQA